MSAPFAPSTLAELARRLEQRRRASARLATCLRDEASTALDDPDLSDLFDSENPGGGTNDVDRAGALRLAELAARAVGAADEALDRLAAGTYGICDGCGDRIPLARLRAVPETSRCVGCNVVGGHALALVGTAP